MRLTRQQMAEKYPDKYLGITAIQYENNDGVTIESAEVIYTDKSEEELLTLQISGVEDIMCWYTTGSKINTGVMTYIELILILAVFTLKICQLYIKK